MVQAATSYCCWSVATSQRPKTCAFQPTLRLGVGVGLDDGVRVVAVVRVVHVMIQAQDVAELVQHHVLGVVAAVRVPVQLAPAQDAPVEPVAVLPEPDAEPGRRIAAEAGEAVDAARDVDAVVDGVAAARVVGERGAPWTGARRSSPPAASLTAVRIAVGGVPAGAPAVVQVRVLGEEPAGQHRVRSVGIGGHGRTGERREQDERRDGRSRDCGSWFTEPPPRGDRRWGRRDRGARPSDGRSRRPPGARSTEPAGVSAPLVAADVRRTGSSPWSTTRVLRRPSRGPGPPRAVRRLEDEDPVAHRGRARGRRPGRCAGRSAGRRPRSGRGAPCRRPWPRPDVPVDAEERPRPLEPGRATRGRDRARGSGRPVPRRTRRRGGRPRATRARSRTWARTARPPAGPPARVSRRRRPAGGARRPRPRGSHGSRGAPRPTARPGRGARPGSRTRSRASTVSQPRRHVQQPQPRLGPVVLARRARPRARDPRRTTPRGRSRCRAGPPISPSVNRCPGERATVVQHRVQPVPGRRRSRSQSAAVARGHLPGTAVAATADPRPARTGGLRRAEGAGQRHDGDRSGSGQASHELHEGPPPAGGLGGGRRARSPSWPGRITCHLSAAGVVRSHASTGPVVPTDPTRYGREAGVIPAQSRYGDRPQGAEVRSPTRRRRSNLREKGQAYPCDRPPDPLLRPEARGLLYSPTTLPEFP